MGSEGVSTKAKDKLAMRLGVVASERCRALVDAYNACAKGRTISVLWACREAHRQSEECISKYVNERNVEVMAQRWVAAGRPRFPDWSKLMEGLIQEG